MTNKCPSCNKTLLIQHSFCPTCGFDLRKYHSDEAPVEPIAPTLGRKSLFLKTALKLFKLFSALTILAVLYSLFEERPSKILTFVISTFLISLFSGLLLLGFAAIGKVKRESFLSRPYPVILTFIIAIGLAKILGSASVHYQFANREVRSAKSSTQSLEIYESADNEVSFNYPPNWMEQPVTRKSTLILLYETNGSLATCNLSIIPQDQNQIEDYNTEYFKRHFAKTYEKVNSITTDQRMINGAKVSLTSCKFLLSTENEALSTVSISLTALHRGKRIMLIIHVPEKNTELIRDDINIMMNSFTVGESQKDVLKVPEFEGIELPEMEEPELPEFEEPELPELELPEFPEYGLFKPA